MDNFCWKSSQRNHSKTVTIVQIKDNVFMNENVQGIIINHSIKIEQLINEILLLVFKPERPNLFLTHICNSSIMHFGGKIKVLNAVGLENKYSQKLQKLSSIRNCFAHSNPSENYARYFSENQEDFTLSVMNSRGIIKNKGVNALHKEFIELYEDLDLALNNLKLQLKSK